MEMLLGRRQPRSHTPEVVRCGVGRPRMVLQVEPWPRWGLKFRLWDGPGQPRGGAAPF